MTQSERKPECIFVRRATAKERSGGSARRKGYEQRIPTAPEGYTVVYKPYGAQGAGYYYVLK